MMTMLLMLPVMMVMPVKKVMKYIYYDGVSVCLCVTKNHHFRVECQRREARRRRGLGAVGRLWPSDDDDDDDDDDDWFQSNPKASEKDFQHFQLSAQQH